MAPKRTILTARHKLGQQLKSLREDKNLSYYAAAKLADLSIAQVKSIENGDKAYTIDSLILILNALNCRDVWSNISK